MTNTEHDLLSQIVSEYEIGTLGEFRRLTLGYVNTSYIIDVERDGAAHQYLLRLYRRGIEEDELVFEHSIINHLVAHGFDKSAAAAALPVHRNTLGYRAAKIERLTGLDLDATDDRGRAWLATLQRNAA